MSLKLVYPGKDTQELVQTLSDDWIIAGPIRAVIHLTGVWHLLSPKSFKVVGPDYLLNNGTMFPPIELENEWVTWAAQSDGNYGWLYYYAADMVEEYVRRFAHKPYIYTRLARVEAMPDAVPEGDMIEPLFASGEIFS